MEKSSFFKSIGGDRKYFSNDFAEYFATMITNGILNGGINLQVYNTNNNMNSIIRSGKGWINGYYYSNTADLTLTHAAASPTLNRYDRVVLRLDLGDSARSVTLKILQGTAASSPSAPDLTRNSTVYELSLAKIYIPANSSHIQSANITDERLDTNLCGLMNSLVKVDTTTFQSTFDAFMASLSSQNYLPTTTFNNLRRKIEMGAN